MPISREQLISLGLLRPAGSRNLRAIANAPEDWDSIRDAEDRTPDEAGLHRPRVLTREESDQRYKVRRRLGRMPLRDPVDLTNLQDPIPPSVPNPRGRGRSGDPRELPNPEATPLAVARRMEDRILRVMTKEPSRRWFLHNRDHLRELAGEDFTYAEVVEAVRNLAAHGSLTHWESYGGAYSLPNPDDEETAERRRVRGRLRRLALHPGRDPWDRSLCPACRALPYSVPTLLCVGCHAPCCAHRAVGHADRVWCLRCYKLIPTEELVARLEYGELPDGRGVREAMDAQCRGEAPAPGTPGTAGVSGGAAGVEQAVQKN